MATARKVAICVNSAALDQVYSALIMAAAASAVAEKVDVCVAMGGVTAFVKGKIGKLDLACELSALDAGFKKRVKDSNYVNPLDLIRQAKDSGNTRFFVCQPAIDLFGLTRADLIGEVDEVIGATAALEIAAEADVTLVY